MTEVTASSASPPIAAAAVSIIGGCGHVGLPFGIALAERGHRVTLVDSSEERAALVRSGQMPFQDRGAEDSLRRVLAAGRLEIAGPAADLADQDIVIITIGTPVDEYLDPKIRGFDEAVDGVLRRMRPGQLLMLRSTVFPGVTERLWRQIRLDGPAVELAYCPERVAQGYALEELSRLPQLVAGMTPAATSRAAALFLDLGARIIELPAVEAELAKLFANAYRYINFAIANQFYMVAERFGADFARIHEAVTTEYPRMKGFALSGFAGGPCLLKDTMQLAAFNHNAFALGQAAMMVNEGLPSFIVEQLRARRDLAGLTVGILGMAFKGNSDDARDSLAYKLRKVLALRCRAVVCTDPYLKDADFISLEETLARADILIVGAPHDEYRELSTDQELIDVFHFVRKRT